jgi:hypothetical protein
MAGGVRFKFAGSKVEVAVGTGSAKTITGVTKANPAVVTATAHGLASGDVVKLAAIVGMTELNGQTAVINVLTANTFELLGIDSTGYGTYVSGGTASPVTFSNMCELTGYNRQGGSSQEIDATTICSTAAESETGLPDYGTTQLDFNFAPRTSVQTAIAAAYQAGTMLPVRVTLPNSGGYMVQLGTVQQTSEQASVGGLWTGSLTIKNSGQRFDIAAVTP